MLWSPMEIENFTHDDQNDVRALTRKISQQDLNKNKYLPPEVITDTCPAPHLQTMVANGQSETPIGATASRLKWQTFCSTQKLNYSPKKLLKTVKPNKN